jgi:hypothetical protein
MFTQALIEGALRMVRGGFAPDSSLRLLKLLLWRSAEGFLCRPLVMIEVVRGLLISYSVISSGPVIQP